MTRVKYYLKNPAANKTSQVIACFHAFGERHKISTKISINPSYWNKNKQIAKELIDFSDGHHINRHLQSFASKIPDMIQFFTDQDIIPSSAMIKNQLFKGSAISNSNSLKFWDLFDRFVDEKRISNADIKNYNNSLRKQLKAGERVFGSKLSFGALKVRSEGFVTAWDNYLTFDAPNTDGDFGLSPNTIGKLHKDLKAFLNWCFDNGFCDPFSLKHLPSTIMDVENVYLTEEELVALFKLKLQNQEKLVRDLFLVGCETGMRFSDFSELTSSQLSNEHIVYSPQKTYKKGAANTSIIIPKSQRLQAILAQYPSPPKFTDSVTVFNKTLRILCEKAGIDKPYHYEVVRQNTRTSVERKKFEMVTSHTARRTFCTLKFLKGMPAQAIMKFSGHKTERNFLKYLKLDAELTAQKFKDYF
jgi:integrase